MLMCRLAAVAALGVSALGMSARAAAPGFDCLVEPSQTVELRAPVDGLIAKVHVRRADRVQRGQVLVELLSDAERLAVESARFRAEMTGPIATARNRVEFARQKSARAEELRRAAFVSPQAADEAGTELRLAEAQLQAALEERDLARIEHRRAVEQLALRTLKSPFDGFVVERLLHPGDLAESGSGRKPVLKLARIDPLHVDVVLPAALFGTVPVGTAMALSLQAPTARRVAPVRLVDRVIDGASGTFVARLELPNHDGRIPSGASCRADFDPPRQDPAPRPRPREPLKP